jgi:hypothetical protein
VTAVRSPVAYPHSHIASHASLPISGPLGVHASPLWHVCRKTDVLSCVRVLSLFHKTIHPHIFSATSEGGRDALSSNGHSSCLAMNLTSSVMLFRYACSVCLLGCTRSHKRSFTVSRVALLQAGDWQQIAVLMSDPDFEINARDRGGKLTAWSLAFSCSPATQHHCLDSSPVEIGSSNQCVSVSVTGVFRRAAWMGASVNYGGCWS